MLSCEVVQMVATVGHNNWAVDGLQLGYSGSYEQIRRNCLITDEKITTEVRNQAEHINSIWNDTMRL
jgi:hypothetical protein